jgi:hypothetical protein
MKKILPLVFISCVACFYTRAQSSCTQTLRTARATYDQGRLHDLPALLEGCLKSGFTEQEKVEAYKLLTLAYIYLEEPAKADEAMLNLLRTDHYFELNKATDPAEFIALYKTFRTKPIYRIGLNLGVNFTQPNVVASIKTNNGSGKYSYRISFQAGIAAEIPINDHFTLNPSLLYQQKSFSSTGQVIRGTDSNGKPISNKTTGTEAQSWVSLPIGVQYLIKAGRYNPYVMAGVSSDFLLGSSLVLQTVQDGAGIVQEKTFNIKSQRQNFNVSALIGAGAKMRMFGGYVTADIRYLYGITKVNSTKTSYTNENIAFDYNWGDSIFKLNSVTVSVGYIQNIFKPKKLSRKK